MSRLWDSAGGQIYCVEDAEDAEKRKAVIELYNAIGGNLKELLEQQGLSYCDYDDDTAVKMRCKDVAIRRDLQAI